MTPATSSPSLWALIRRFWRHLSPRRRGQFVLLLVFMVASAFSEVLSIGALLPFIAALAAPDTLLRHPAAASLARWAGIENAADLLLPLTLTFIAAALIAGAMR